MEVATTKTKPPSTAISDGQVGVGASGAVDDPPTAAQARSPGVVGALDGLGHQRLGQLPTWVQRGAMRVGVPWPAVRAVSITRRCPG